MADRDDAFAALPAGATFFDLWRYELPKALVKPSVEACRMINTVADTLFYNVGELVADLAERDLEVQTLPPRADGRPWKLPSRIISLDALTNPEGALLLIDASVAPFIHRYDDVEAFLDSPYAETRQVQCITITGVGSSAYGSAALGWQISRALECPVLAIIPGYGVADVIQQGLGGWFGFGLHDWLDSKSAIQQGLARLTPGPAQIGRELAATVPGSKDINNAPVFRYGSGSSDVLHALLERRPGQWKWLIGHSKGALVIGNAVADLSAEAISGLEIITLGCPISAAKVGSKGRQALGRIDALGILNAWGNWPTEWVTSWHTTNLDYWLPMHADRIVAGLPHPSAH